MPRKGTCLLAGGVAALVVVLGGVRQALAHCDTLDGPVVAAARVALERSDVTPVLKWVKKENEPEIRAAFARTLTVRGRGPEAKELADTYLFETLIRLHRAGEGAPYTGLKPAGTGLEPAVAGADAALDGGSVQGLVKLVAGDVAEGIRQRFARASEARKHMDTSVEAGREYVDAYVEYVHYVERLHAAASGGVHHGGPEAAAAEHDAR
jgi:hypothetical protein